MSLMWSRPTHEGKCPGRFQIADDFRQAQKRQSTDECPALGEFCWYLGPPTWREHLEAMGSSVQVVTADSTQTTVLPPTEICLGKVPASIQRERRGWNGSPRQGFRALGGIGSVVLCSVSTAGITNTHPSYASL